MTIESQEGINDFRQEDDLLDQTQWKNIKLSETLTVTLTQINDYGHTVSFNGTPNLLVAKKYLEKRKLFLQSQSILSRPQIEYYDYKNFSDLMAITFREELVKHWSTSLQSGQVLAVVLYNLPLVLKLSYGIYLKTKLKNLNVFMSENQETAFLKGKEILQKRYSEISLENVLGDKFTMSHWKMTRQDYNVSFYTLPNDILYNEASGELRLEYVDDFFALHAQVLRESSLGDGRPYWKIMNWGKYDKVSWVVRTKYIEKIKELFLNSNCQGIVICAPNTMLKAIVRVSKSFISQNVAMVENLDDAILWINEDRQRLANKEKVSWWDLWNFDSGKEKKIENESNKLLQFIGNINWDQTGMDLPNPENIAQEMWPIYEAISIIKHDFDNVLKERSHIHEQLIINSRMASIGELAAAVGHEINNPLTIIKGSVDICARLLEEKKYEVMKERIGKIEQASDRVAKVVSSLKLMASNTSETELIPVDVHTVVNEVINLMALFYERDNICIGTNLCAQKSIINANSGHIEQIVLMILEHIKVNFKDTKEKTIFITSYNQGPNFVLEIKDNGPGMEEKECVQVFNLFYSTYLKDKGTGINLGVVKMIVERLGGKADVFSVLGNGTSYKFLFNTVENCN